MNEDKGGGGWSEAGWTSVFRSDSSGLKSQRQLVDESNCPGVVSPEDVQRRVREDDRCTPWLVVVQFDTELMVRVRDGSVQLVQYQ